MLPDSAAGVDRPAVLLRITRGFAGPRTVEAEGSEITIGRSKDATLRFDPQRDLACASGIHARLTLEAGQWMIECLHPSGLRVVEAKGRPRRVEEGQRAALTLPAEIELGSNGPRFEASVTGGPIPATAIGDSSLSDQPVTQIPASMLTEVKRSNSRLHVLGISLAAAVVLLGGTFVLVQMNEGQASPIDPGPKYLAGAPESNRLQELARQAEESVWIVGIGDDAGDFMPAGTAWTVRADQLATNAHVALSLQQLVASESERRSVHMEARRAANDSNSLRLSIASVHPAFTRWERKLRDRRRPGPGNGAMPIEFVTPGDVALLQVDDGDPGEPLPLLVNSPDSTSTAVSAGDEVVYLGFPMEGVVGQPTLQTCFGRLTAVTDFFHQPAADAQHLLHHNAFSVGGASGSPLLNRNGQVIGLVTAMNRVAVPGGRVPIGLNYATHVAMLHELLDGDAERVQDLRDPIWDEQLLQASLPDQEFLKRRAEAVGISGEQFEAARIETFVISKPGEEGAVFRPLSRGMETVAIAHAADRTDIDLFVVDGTSNRPVASNTSPDCFPMLQVAADRSGRPLQLVIIAAPPLDSPCEVTLRLIPVGSVEQDAPAGAAARNGPNRM